MGGDITGRPASLAGCTAFFVLLSAALAATTPLSTLPSGGYHGFYEQVCPWWLSSMRVLSLMLKALRSTSTANRKALVCKHHALVMMQMYVTTSSTTITTFPDFPNLTPTYTFTLPNLTSTAQPGLWSNSVSGFQRRVYDINTPLVFKSSCIGPSYSSVPLLLARSQKRLWHTAVQCE